MKNNRMVDTMVSFLQWFMNVLGLFIFLVVLTVIVEKKPIEKFDLIILPAVIALFFSPVTFRDSVKWLFSKTIAWVVIFTGFLVAFSPGFFLIGGYICIGYILDLIILQEKNDSNNIEKAADKLIDRAKRGIIRPTVV